MTLKVGFVYNIKTVFVAKLIKPRVVLILAGSYHVPAVDFYNFYIPFHVVKGNNMTEGGVGLVPVCAECLYLFAVYVDNLAFFLDSLEADSYKYHFIAAEKV